MRITRDYITRLISFGILQVLLLSITVHAQYKSDRKSPVIRLDLQEALSEHSSGETQPAWIYFTDKGLAGEKAFQNAALLAESSLSKRAIQRRMNRGQDEQLVDYHDLPVHPPYIDAILQIDGVHRHRTTSNWFNAISVELDYNALAPLESQPFVRSVELVRSGGRDLPGSGEYHHPGIGKSSQAFSTLNYGPSFGQLQQINVPAAHIAGYTGKDVRVLMVDTGYMLDHEAIPNDRIVAEYDFIHKDSVTANQFGDHPQQDFHGTATASLVGAAVDSVLYGPAYECEYVLAKTEILDQEIQVEEDYYAAALEWGEELGADVVSSSLGYIDWYTFSDMDGNTAVTTRAVERAMYLGMTVITATGNENLNNWGHIIAPADADSVVSVGAVDADGNIADFSSRGPTYDGRTKPEVVAQGVNTWLASSYATDAYGSTDGTSLSTPLVAGVAALILQAHPDWSPYQVREALIQTASLADNPNNAMGWGIVNALAAINYDSVAERDTFFIEENFPNPFRNVTYLRYAVPDGVELNEITLDIFNIRGQKVAIKRSQHRDSYFRWKPGPDIASGIYLYRLNAGNYTTTGKFTYIR